MSLAIESRWASRRSHAAQADKVIYAQHHYDSHPCHQGCHAFRVFDSPRYSNAKPRKNGPADHQPSFSCGSSRLALTDCDQKVLYCIHWWHGAPQRRYRRCNLHLDDVFGLLYRSTVLGYVFNGSFQLVQLTSYRNRVNLASRRGGG